MSGPKPLQFGINVSSLKVFAGDVKRADKALSKNLRLKLKKGADLVADQTRANASFSKQIPATVKATSSPSSARVRVSAGNAAPLENRGKAGFFRHPVFGNRENWVDQKAHPFALPALVAKADEVAKIVAEALDEFARDAGFK